MKGGGTVAFWVKVGLGLGAACLLWRIYRGTIGFVEDVGEAVGKVTGNDIVATDPATLARAGAATRRVYDPALDPRPWWERPFILAPSEAFRPATAAELAARSGPGGRS